MDDDGHTPERGALQILGKRLAAHGWILAAALAAILLVGAAGGRLWALLVGAAMMLAAAALRGAEPAPTRVETSGTGTAGRAGVTSEALMEAVGDPLLIFDRTGSLVHANAAARRAFGMVPVGLSLPMKFRAPEMQQLIGGLLAGKAETMTADYVELVPIDRVHRVVGVAMGEGSDLFLLAFRDQSEVRRIDRMRADFIANASHELRTPLASISGFIETLRGPARNDPKAREQFLQIMHDQTGRMARLIDDLLSLSRLEMKAIAPSGGRIELRGVIEAVIDTLAPLAADSGVVVERRFNDGDLSVAGDRDELFQVFENLLENACKYGESGGRVIVSLDRSGGEAEVSVTDFGPGIPAEHIPRITERFYRVDVETSRSRKGTGLGLAIVKHIVTRHGGRLSIRSEPGKGATFTVHLALSGEPH